MEQAQIIMRRLKNEAVRRAWTYNVIHMTMGDEKEVLAYGLLRAATNIEGQIESWENDASFMTSNGRALNWVSFNLHSLPRFHWVQVQASATSGFGCHS